MWSFRPWSHASTSAQRLFCPQMRLPLRGKFLTFNCACLASTSSGSSFSAKQPPLISTSHFMMWVFLSTPLGVLDSPLGTASKIVGAELALAALAQNGVPELTFLPASARGSGSATAPGAGGAGQQPAVLHRFRDRCGRLYGGGRHYIPPAAALRASLASSRARFCKFLSDSRR